MLRTSTRSLRLALLLLVACGAAAAQSEQFLLSTKRFHEQWVPFVQGLFGCSAGRPCDEKKSRFDPRAWQRLRRSAVRTFELKGAAPYTPAAQDRALRENAYAFDRVWQPFVRQLQGCDDRRAACDPAQGVMDRGLWEQSRALAARLFRTK